MKIFFLVLALNLSSCKAENQHQQSEKIYEVPETVLEEYKDLDFLLCSKSLDYSNNTIVTNSRPLKEALDVDLILEFQEFSPPSHQISVIDLLKDEDLEYMKNHIENDLLWEEEKVIIEVKSCKNNMSTDNLALSKPLFNKENNLSLVFLTKSTITEYTVTLFILRKEKGSWQKVWSLNM